MDWLEGIDVVGLIMQYGRNVLNSEIFKRAAERKHHLHGTVLDHTINVCVVSIWLCHQLKSRGIDVKEKDLIQAALCHDLGMVDQEGKYKGRLDSWKSHSEESVKIAHELIPDLSEAAEDMIRSHMWPVAGSAPRSNEAMMLCIADKYASMADWKQWLTKHKFASHIKDQLELGQA